MFERIEACDRDELFKPLSQRAQRGMFFLRIADFNEGISDYIWRVHESARASGAIIEGQISNPDERQLGYYNDVLGGDFRPEKAFIEQALSKWTPRMSVQNRSEFAQALYDQLMKMRAQGKPDGVLKNVYIKMMCWLYYRFERVMPFLGKDDVPKLLYEGSFITNHELIFLRALLSIGVDIVLVEVEGEKAYLKVDPEGRFSQKLTVSPALPFPADYSLKALRKQMAQRKASVPPQNAMPPRQNAVPPQNAAPRNTVPPQATVTPPRSTVPQATVTPPRNPATPAVSASAAPRRGVQFGAPMQPTATAPQSVPRVAQSTSPAASNAGSAPAQNESKYHIRFERPAYLNNTSEATKGGYHIQTQAPAKPSAPQFTAPAHQPSSIERRFQQPARKPCTNAWMTRPELNQVLMAPINRGGDTAFYYNAFVRLTGVNDKLTYESELYRFYQEMSATRRKMLILDGEIPKPEMEEIEKIRRRNYRTIEELIVDISGNLPSAAHADLQKMIQIAFVRTMIEAAKGENNLNRLTVTAVYLLCWILRYQGELFHGWRETDIGVCVKMGACETQAEALYMQYLSLLPVDVVIFAPDLNRPDLVSSDTLLDLRGEESLPTIKFPRQSGTLQMSTAAAHAQRDINNLLYQDSGMYRNHQFAHAEAITLQTTYDEIFILWDKELKYRSNFSTGDGVANIPVLYATVFGVEKGKILPYWQKIKALKDMKDTLFIAQFPYVSPGESNLFQADAVKGIKNERLRRDEIKSSRRYPFGLLREEVQEQIFDKVQQMLDQRLIKGTFENGTEYTVLATVLNLKKELLRMIQAFDFTKSNPKVVAVHTLERSPSLEDAILLTFLNRMGFDILLFVPTGYQTIERYLNDNYPIEHQVGEYMYDLPLPDFSTITAAKGHSWLNNLLRRGI